MNREVPTVYRIFLFCFACVLSGSRPARGQSTLLALASGTAGRGVSVSLPLSLTSGSVSPAGLQWTFEYSPQDISGLSAVAAGTAVDAEKTLSCASPAAGWYGCLLYGVNQNVIPDGVVANVTFAVSPSAAGGAAEIRVTGTVSASLGGDEIPSAGSGATITIPSSAVLSGLSCSPVLVYSRGSSRCTVSLSSPAKAGESCVQLDYTAQGVLVTLPPAVCVATAQSSVEFSVGMGAAALPTTVRISANLNWSSQGVDLQLLAADTGILVTPSSADLPGGQTVQFSARLPGDDNPAVAWSLNPATGTISDAGLYTAPVVLAAPQVVTVIATSLQDPFRVGTAIVDVISPNPAMAPSVVPLRGAGAAGQRLPKKQPSAQGR